MARAVDVLPPDQAADTTSTSPDIRGLNVDPSLEPHQSNEDPTSLLHTIQDQHALFLKERQIRQSEDHFSPDMILQRYFKKYYGDKNSLHTG
jgi:hypothetical protein